MKYGAGSAISFCPTHELHPVIITAPDQPGTGVPDTGTTLFLLGGAFVAMIWIRRRMAMA